MPFSIMLRIGAFVTLSFLVFNGIWWLAIPLFIYCLSRYNAYEFVIMAFCIDVYFAPGMFTLDYTVVSLMALIAAIYLRPFLRYKQSLYS
jgi:membrane protein implicated in regulation of membrane protease activity